MGLGPDSLLDHITCTIGPTPQPSTIHLASFSWPACLYPSLWPWLAFHFEELAAAGCFMALN